MHITYNIHQREIKLKLWNTKDEKDFLIFVNDNVETLQQFEDSVHMAFTILLDKEEKYKDLDYLTKFILLVETRKVILNDEIKTLYRCPECNNINESYIPLYNWYTLENEPTLFTVKYNNMEYTFSTAVSDILWSLKSIKNTYKKDSVTRDESIKFFNNIN